MKLYHKRIATYKYAQLTGKHKEKDGRGGDFSIYFNVICYENAFLWFVALEREDLFWKRAGGGRLMLFHIGFSIAEWHLFEQSRNQIIYYIRRDINEG